jgi:phosphopentomutase
VVPLPELLRRAGLLTSGFVAQPPFMYRGLARILAHRLGIDRPSFRGLSAFEIVDAAVDTLESQRAGLVLLHLPDADRAGHAHGWMSKPYRDAAVRLDAAMGRIAGIALDRSRNDTLVIACADHGGGGTVQNDHESLHPLDCTIPIIMAGAGVRRGRSLRAASILDIPATVLAALRVAPPACFAGRPMLEAFAWEAEAA